MDQFVASSSSSASSASSTSTSTSTSASTSSMTTLATQKISHRCTKTPTHQVTMDQFIASSSSSSTSPSQTSSSSSLFASGDGHWTPKDLLALGDSHFVDGNLNEALEAYAAALAVLQVRDNGGNFQRDAAIRIRTLSHRSATLYGLERYSEALDDAEASLELLPSLSKNDSSSQQPSNQGSNALNHELRPGEGELCHIRACRAAAKLQRHVRAEKYLDEAAEWASLNNRPVNPYSGTISELRSHISGEKRKRGSTNSASKAGSTKTAAAAAAEAPEGVPAVTGRSSTAASRSDVRELTRSARATAGKPDKAPKLQYYQSSKVMTVSLLEVGVRPEDLTVEFGPKMLHIELHRRDDKPWGVCGTLHAEIDVSKSWVSHQEEKVLIKLRKVEQREWNELFDKGNTTSPFSKPNLKTDSETSSTEKQDRADDAKAPPEAAKVPPEEATLSKDPPPKRPSPYASHKDWDAIESEIAEQAEDEPPEGEAAVHDMFKKIYADASDDTRRAMAKSYQTSGGTVLTTNWDEAKSKDYESERTAPKGLEWKTWDGEKVPMKDDD